MTPEERAKQLELQKESVTNANTYCEHFYLYSHQEKRFLSDMNCDLVEIVDVSVCTKCGKISRWEG